MTRMCAITRKKPMKGNTVSHANNRTKRRFLPNLHTLRLWSEDQNRYIKLRVSAHGLRIINKIGLTKALEKMKLSELAESAK